MLYQQDHNHESPVPVLAELPCDCARLVVASFSKIPFRSFSFDPKDYSHLFHQLTENDRGASGHSFENDGDDGDGVCFSYEHSSLPRGFLLRNHHRDHVCCVDHLSYPEKTCDAQSYHRHVFYLFRGRVFGDFSLKSDEGRMLPPRLRHGSSQLRMDWKLFQELQYPGKTPGGALSVWTQNHAISI